MDAIVREETDARAWDRYVDGHPRATQYHRWVWKSVIEASFGHRTYYLSARRGGAIVGILPLVLMRSHLFGRFLVSLPFVNYGGLVCDGPAAGGALLRTAEGIGRETGVGFIELRHLEKSPLLAITREHKVTMVLDLERDAGAQWDAFDAKLRNQVRKAQKSGLLASIGGPELLDDFYDVFSENMRDLGTPVYSRRFFATMLDRLGGSMNVATVRYQDRAVAAGLLVRFREKLEIPWASSVRRYNALCPNNLLYWRALQWAIEHGMRQFDFGRSTPGGGTYRFKEQWGAKPFQLHWQYDLLADDRLPDLSPDSAKYRLAVDVWRRLPLGLTRWLGPRVVKYIP